MKISAFAAAVLGLAAIVPAAAQARPPAPLPVAQRSANLEARIDQGVRSGRLTRPEARRLTAEHARLRRLEVRYRNGGLDQWERRDLRRRHDALAARIRVDTHDRRYRRG